MSTKEESSRHGEDNDAMETQAEENSNNFSPEEEILLDIVREYIDSLLPEKCGSNVKSVFFKLVLWIEILATSCEIVSAVEPHWWQESGNGLVLSGI